MLGMGVRLHTVPGGLGLGVRVRDSCSLGVGWDSVRVELTLDLLAY